MKQIAEEEVRAAMRYKSERSKALGLILGTIEEESLWRIKQFVKTADIPFTYEECLESENYVGLFNIAKATHIAEPAAFEQQIDDVRRQLRNIKQGDMSLEKYGEEITQKVSQLLHLVNHGFF